MFTRDYQSVFMWKYGEFVGNDGDSTNKNWCHDVMGKMMNLWDFSYEITGHGDFIYMILCKPYSYIYNPI